MKSKQHLKSAVFFLAGVVLGGSIIYFGTGAGMNVLGILLILIGGGYSWKEVPVWIDWIKSALDSVSTEVFGESKSIEQKQTHPQNSPQLVMGDNSRANFTYGEKAKPTKRKGVKKNVKKGTRKRSR